MDYQRERDIIDGVAEEAEANVTLAYMDEDDKKGKKDLNS